MGAAMRIASGIGLLAWLAVACAPETRDAPTAADEPSSVDLAERLPAAFVESDFSGLPFRDVAERRYLTSGWHPFEESAKGQAFAWTHGRTTVVELPVATPGPLLVRMRVDPGRRAGVLPPQQVAILWNDEVVLRAKLRWQSQTLQFSVPVSQQRTGLNRLQIRPHYWFDATHVYSVNDRRTLALKILGVEMIRQRQELAAGGDTPGVIARDGNLVQRAGSAVQFFLSLDRQPRLVTTLSLDPKDAAEVFSLIAALNEAGHDAQARWRVRLVDGKGDEHHLAEGALDALVDNPESLEVDLGSWAGQAVGLSLSATVSVVPKRGGIASPLPALPPLDLVWQTPRIEGVRTAPPPASVVSRRPYNVLMVLFDTLRADHLSAYGNSEVRTPRINELVRSGVLFKNAVANASWTRPAVASLLTGTYPSAHRTEVMKTDSLPEPIPFLPEILKQRGYRTVSVVNNANVDASFGFGRGFDSVHPIYQKERELERMSTAVERASFVWNESIAPHIEGDDPFFVYLHEIDPHAPYSAPEPFRSMYTEDYVGYIGDNGYNKLINGGLMTLGEEDVRHLNDLYKGEISFMDGYLGWLLDELERSGRRRDTLVVFVSDHGEEFNEHGGIKHGRSLYEHQVRVPLVLSLPGVLPEGERVLATAEQVDVVPTILDLLGVDVPPDVQGQSLLPAIAAGGRPAPRPSFAKVGREGVDGTAWNSVRVGRYKLVRQRFKVGGMQRFLLFDLQDDPAEKRDLWASRFTLGQTMRQQLALHEQRSAEVAERVGKPEPATLDRAVQKNLRALGYLE